MNRLNISSESEYEKPIGFSRAVRISNIISVAGTAPIAADGSTAQDSQSAWRILFRNTSGMQFYWSEKLN